MKDYLHNEKNEKYSGTAKIAFVILAVILIVLLFRVPCIIRTLTGVPCPTCGISRAWIAAFGGDIKAALRYQAFFFLLPLAVAGVVLSSYIIKKKELKFALNLLSFIILLANFIYYFIRLAGGNIL